MLFCHEKVCFMTWGGSIRRWMVCFARWAEGFGGRTYAIAPVVETWAGCGEIIVDLFFSIPFIHNSNCFRRNSRMLKHFFKRKEPKNRPTQWLRLCRTGPRAHTMGIG